MSRAHHYVREAAAAAAAQDSAFVGKAALDPHAVSPGLTFSPGDRVFDLVTGQEGVVTGGYVQSVLVPATKQLSG